MDNLERVKEMLKEENSFNVTNSTESQHKEDREKRIVNLLGIIAEELCLLRQKPTVVNNYNVSK